MVTAKQSSCRQAKLFVDMSLARFCHDMTTFCSVDQSSISSCRKANSCVDMSLTRFCCDMLTFSSVDKSSIAKSTILISCHVVMSLQLICRSITRRWNLWVLDLQMSCSDLTGDQSNTCSPGNGPSVKCPVESIQMGPHCISTPLTWT